MHGRWAWIMAAISAACGGAGGGGESPTEASGTVATSSSTTGTEVSTTATGSGPSATATADPTEVTGSGDRGSETDPDPNQNPLEGSGPVERVAQGFGFVEGPVWLADAGSLLFTDIPADTIYRFDPQRGASVFESGSGAHANGLNLDGAGNLLACEHATRRVTRRTKATPEVIADEFMGTPLNSPNDVVVHPNGTVYFTDPMFGGNPPDLGFQGVYQVSPQGVIALIDDANQQPNGIGLSPDSDTLYVADTPTGNVVRYALDDEGVASGRDVLVDAGQAADGMSVDVAGNLYVAVAAGVVVLRADGTSWGTIAVPEQPANCSFGGADRRTLYITARSSVYAVRLALPGL